MLSHYWYFQDVGFRFDLHVCNKCQDVLMSSYELENIVILNVKEYILDVFYGGLVEMRLLIG